MVQVGEAVAGLGWEGPGEGDITQTHRFPGSLMPARGVSHLLELTMALFLISPFEKQIFLGSITFLEKA